MKTRWNVTGRERAVISIAALAVTFAAGVVFADSHEDEHSVPAEVGFSGWLADSKGEAITGDVDLVVGVFDAATAGTQVGTFTLSGVEVDRGRFSITLSSEDATIWDGSTRWVEVSVDGDTLSPRTAIVSTPYALRAGVATKLTDAARADVLADAEERIAALEAKLASVRVEGTDVYFEGVNVHVRDGSGSTLGTMNLPSRGNDPSIDLPFQGSGLGNLIVGYNEAVGGEERTGQHNLVVGVGHSYLSFGGLVSGYNNRAQGHSTGIVGGWQGETDDAGAVVIGGDMNKATANGAVAVGGERNQSDSQQTVTVGGEANFVNSDNAVSVGGKDNYIERDGDQGEGSVIVGGEENEIAKNSDTEAQFAVIVGGYKNVIEGGDDEVRRSVIVGGEGNEMGGADAVVVGGSNNNATAKGAVQISGTNSSNTNGNTGNLATQ